MILSTPDGHLYYELRGTGPLVVLLGAPMDATAFAPLAELLVEDHTVLTTDPRGINRSRLADPDRDSTPEQRAGDLARLIEHVDAGPAAVLGSSGGAVSALACAQAFPDQLHTVVAHEPPLLEFLPAEQDRARAREATEDMITTYLAGDVRGGWVKFLANAGIRLPDEVIGQLLPATPQARADDRYQYEHMIRPTTYWKPDLAALAGGPRIVIGIGEESGGQFCDRTSNGLAAALGRQPAKFPGGHVGFVEDPPAFAERLREVLRDRASVGDRR